MNTASECALAAPSTVRDNLEEAISRANGLAQRVAGLVERLVGSVPEPSEPTSCAGKVDGTFNELSAQAGHTTKLVMAAHDALDRLEARLG